jgi:hypothetical protein
VKPEKRHAGRPASSIEACSAAFAWRRCQRTKKRHTKIAKPQPALNTVTVVAAKRHAGAEKRHVVSTGGLRAIERVVAIEEAASPSSAGHEEASRGCGSASQHCQKRHASTRQRHLRTLKC